MQYAIRCLADFPISDSDFLINSINNFCIGLNGINSSLQRFCVLMEYFIIAVIGIMPLGFGFQVAEML
nr:MAG TPA: hypothetical protein [Caudoviricetes sp.]